MTKIPRLFKLMEEQVITDYKLSADTGITQSCISSWRSGKSTPNPETLIILAEYFNVTVDWLVGKSNVPKYSIDVETINKLWKFVLRATDLYNPRLETWDELTAKVGLTAKELNRLIGIEFECETKKKNNNET